MLLGDTSWETGHTAVTAFFMDSTLTSSSWSHRPQGSAFNKGIVFWILVLHLPSPAPHENLASSFPSPCPTCFTWPWPLDIQFLRTFRGIDRGKACRQGHLVPLKTSLLVGASLFWLILLMTSHSLLKQLHIGMYLQRTNTGSQSLLNEKQDKHFPVL